MRILIVLPLFSAPTFAQTYEREAENTWQVEANGHRYQVRPGVVSVLPKDGVAVEGLGLPEGTEVLRSNRLGIVDLALPAGVDSLDMVRALEAGGQVEFACVDTEGTWFSDPDDPQYSAQYHLNNTGQLGGTPGADVGALEAWVITTGDPTVITALLDSGTQITHPDLSDNLWTNPGELANGIDDDGNGYIDDFHGWDFEGNDNDLSTTFGHGTQTAGVLGATTNNATGLASLAGGFGPALGCTYIPTKIGTAGPIGSVVDDAILYAMDEGARVLNLSFGIGTSPAVDAAIATAHAAGVSIVVASGNSGGSISYPAVHPLTIAVGATDRNDSLAGFSSGGPQLDLVAPGVSIQTTAQFNTYSTASGTSFSAPLVASAVALLLSVDPGLDAEQVRTALRDSAHDLGAPGFDFAYGDGRLDAGALLAPYVCRGLNYCTSLQNSSGGPGLMDYSGSTSVSANDLVLEAVGLPQLMTPGIFYYGPAAVSLPFGNGIRCVGGTIQRLPVISTTVGGTASYALDITNPPQASGQISADEVWYFQFWFRDPAAGGSFFNLTDGLEVTFCP